MFRIVNALLARNNISPLPEYSSLTELANGFNDFFIDKITGIRDNIISTHFNGIQPTPVEPVSELDFPEMDVFHHVSERSVENRIRELPSKSCELDPMPIILLKLTIEVVSPVITCIITISLLSGEFSKNLKDALLKPLIKKMGLELFFKSFQPVSNLLHVSKLVERFAADRLVEHVTQNEFSEKFHSAYRASHSTKTALIHLRNDILLNMDR